MKYAKLTKNLFRSKELSRNEINLFTVDLISRLNTLQNSVLPEADKNLLIALHHDFANTYGELATHHAVQKGGTISRQEAYDAVLAFIAKEEGTIKSTFGKKSPAYTEFYPQGLTEYYGATVEGIKILLFSYSEAAAKYATKLPADFISTLTTLQTAYIHARDIQVSSKSNKKSAETALQQNRKALTKHLSKCVLIIAAHNIDNEAAFNSYFNFGLLRADNEKASTVL